MQYAIEILQERLNSLNEAYQEFVVNGTVDANSDVAVNNERKRDSLTKAIHRLKPEDKVLKTDNYLLADGNCNYTGNTCAGSFNKTSPICQKCKVYTITLGIIQKNK